MVTKYRYINIRLLVNWNCVCMVEMVIRYFKCLYKCICVTFTATIEINCICITTKNQQSTWQRTFRSAFIINPYHEFHFGINDMAITFFTICLSFLKSDVNKLISIFKLLYGWPPWRLNQKQNSGSCTID